MQETVNWSSELTLSREKVVMSEEYSIANRNTLTDTENKLEIVSGEKEGEGAW